MRKLCYWICHIALVSCQLAVNDRVSLEGFDFGTTDPSELFFKNVRQSAYDLEERAEARMNVFRMSAASRDSTEIYPAIIHHWTLDKAYLWLEPGSAFPEQFEVTISSQSENVTLHFDGSSPVNHIEVATAIFHGILDDATFSYEDWELLPRGSKEREAFRIILNDYYRLVGLK